jgi:hypothetical protein
MGVVNLKWYEDRGLLKKIKRTLTEDSTLTNRKAGDVVEYSEIIQEYSCGRIDCRGEDLGQFGDEIGVDPMKSEDWHRFGVWLNTVETDYMWTLDQLVKMYERTNPKIEWWVDK